MMMVLCYIISLAGKPQLIIKCTIVAISLTEQIMCIYWGWQNIFIRESTVHWTPWQFVISNSEISSVLWLHELDRRGAQRPVETAWIIAVAYFSAAMLVCANTERYHGYISSFPRIRGQTSLCFWILAKHWYFIDKLRLFF